MPVLVEAISVIVRNRTIAEKYPGGMAAYWVQCPNRTICSDDHITRVGFLTPDDARSFIGRLIGTGIRFVENDEAIEIAVIDQEDGLTGPCRWIKVGDHPDGFRYAAAYEDLGDRIAKPAGWRFEDSLSEAHSSMPSDTLEGLSCLRSEIARDVYWPDEPQQETATGCPDNLNLLEIIRRQLVAEYGDDARPIWRVTPRGRVHFAGKIAIRDLVELRLKFPKCAMVLAPPQGSDEGDCIAPIGLTELSEVPRPQRAAILLLPVRVEPDWLRLRTRWWNPWHWCLRLFGLEP